MKKTKKMRKMKKIVSCLALTAALVCSTAAYAKIGDEKGRCETTSIAAYINGYALPSYAYNGQSVIVAEDLANYGFDVVWNGDTRSLVINENNTKAFSPMSFTKSWRKSGSPFMPVLETDIKTYVNGQRVSSYAIQGYTVIPMEELTMAGTVSWEPDKWALMMNTQNPNRAAKIENVPINFDGMRMHPNSNVWTFTYPTGATSDHYLLHKAEVASMSGKETVYCYAVDDDIKVYTDYVLERGWVKDTKAAGEAFAFTSEGKRTWAVWDSDRVLKIMHDTF